MDGTYGDDEYVRHAWNSTMLPLKSQECKESKSAQKNVKADETNVAFWSFSALFLQLQLGMVLSALPTRLEYRY